LLSPPPVKEDMEFNNVNDCVPEVTLVEGKSTYELMRDAHVAELVERFKAVEAASVEL
jgi:hypothetical protein